MHPGGPGAILEVFMKPRMHHSHITKDQTMTRWIIDPTHSEVQFRVSHLVVSTVTGHFDRFDAAIEAENEDFTDARIVFEADANSINTKNEQRDGHLKSVDFFDAALHPKISFVSTSVEKISDHELRVVGNMTMRGVTRQIALEGIYNGTVAGFGGNQVAGFEIQGKVNRFDFGLQWNALTEAGGMIVGNEVKIEIFAEFTKVHSTMKAA
jgi:polyisoprenoid-binding protein YceI